MSKTNLYRPPGGFRFGHALVMGDFVFVIFRAVGPPHTIIH